MCCKTTFQSGTARPQDFYCFVDKGSPEGNAAYCMIVSDNPPIIPALVQAANARRAEKRIKEKRESSSLRGKAPKDAATLDRIEMGLFSEDVVQFLSANFLLVAIMLFLSQPGAYLLLKMIGRNEPFDWQLFLFAAIVSLVCLVFLNSPST